MWTIVLIILVTVNVVRSVHDIYRLNTDLNVLYMDTCVVFVFHSVRPLYIYNYMAL